ncbi:hypothetical protein [Rhizobium sp. UGM030330-04]|uniref:hypothetical protein n=1 Tax=Rhizobium sp. UGM030330-04 TaxID=1378077 RepID=UPI000D820286|nr:hypothetical protein [Rhizobium sp. UGM030330-04]PYG54368.1 hypothetical protein N434_04629 [Rhizobium sp. UGM030330-04]
MTCDDELFSHKDLFKGETAFLLASGPSVASEDLSLLRDNVIMTVNGATLLQEKFDLSPTYFCTTDSRFLADQDLRPLGTTRVHKDTTRLIRDVIRPFDSPGKHKTLYVRTIGKNGFSTDMSRGFYFWCTSISLGIQMAWFTGIKRLVLVGVDLNYFGQPRFYSERNAQPVDPFLSVQIQNVVSASKRFESDGRSIILASERSMLRPYINYQPLSTVV